jgi:hypothetical protein
MALGTLTAANSIIMLGVTTLFPTPQQIQEFTADDVFDSEAIDASEVIMGVDGNLSGGMIFKELKWSIKLQGNSSSNTMFDQWYANQIANLDAYTANGTIRLPGIRMKFVMTNGFLTSYQPLSSVKKLIQARTHIITWESVVPQPA